MSNSMESSSIDNPSTTTTPAKNELESSYSYLINESIFNGLPMIIYLVSIYAIFSINLHFVGQENDVDLIDAVGFGATLFNCTAIGLIISLNNGLIVVCSQAFGAEDYKLVGYYFHKGIIINAVVFALSFLVLLFSGSIVKLLGMSLYVQNYIYDMVIYSSIGLFELCIFDTTKAYLMAHKIYVPQLIVQVIISALHWLWAYIFIDYLDLKAKGVGISIGITYFIGVALLYAYIFIGQPTKESFFWFKKESFNRIFSLVKIEVFNGSLTYLEWITYEIAIIFSSAYAPDQMGGQITLYNIICIIYMIPLGYATAFNQSIGEYIGAKDKVKLKRLLHIGMGAIFVIVIFEEPFLCFLNTYIIKFFANDEGIINACKGAIYVYCIVLPIDFTQCLLGAYIRGIGREKAASICFFICYYLIGLPLAYLFGNILDGYARGLWTGIGIGICCMCLASTVLTLKTDIDYQINFIEKRLDADRIVSGNENTDVEKKTDVEKQTDYFTNDPRTPLIEDPFSK